MKLRIALFGSYYRGLAALETLLSLQKRYPEIVICGVATDDPTKSWVSPSARVWQYPHTLQEETMVGELAKEQSIDVWKDRVKTPEFLERFKNVWKPDICYMTTFGQKISPEIFDYPLLGFYNFHPCVSREWPSYVGGNPFRLMLDARESSGVIAMHQVDENWDHGKLVAFSRAYPIQANDSVPALHKRSSPEAGLLMKWHIGEVSNLYKFDYAAKLSPDTPAVTRRTEVPILKAG